MREGRTLRPGASHFQALQSYAASIHSSMTALSGCCDSIVPFRRISSGMRGLRRSRSDSGGPDLLFGGADTRVARRACFFPVSGRQDLARGQNFDTDDVPLGIDIVNERSGLFRPLDFAAPDGDIHRVGFSVVGYVGHGFRLAFRSNIAPITRMLEFVSTQATRRVTGFFIGVV